MRPLELVMKAFDSAAGEDLLDNIMALRLKQTRDMYIKERERLDEIAKYRTLEPHEADDWNTLVMDIAALNRVLDTYGVYDD